MLPVNPFTPPNPYRDGLQAGTGLQHAFHSKHPQAPARGEECSCADWLTELRNLLSKVQIGRRGQTRLHCAQACQLFTQPFLPSLSQDPQAKLLGLLAQRQVEVRCSTFPKAKKLCTMPALNSKQLLSQLPSFNAFKWNGHCKCSRSMKH